MTSFLRRLRARLRNRRFDDELLEELRVHEEMKRVDFERAGRSPGEARVEARRALGNVTLMREDARAVWIAPWLESVIQDVRYAVRSLLRQPAHSLTAGVVLVLAIGVNTSLFALLKATALDPWPVPDPASVVRIWARAGNRPVGPSVDEYRFLREHARSFAGLVAHTSPGNGARLQAPGRGEIYLPTVWASANFFTVLGARMHLGSGFIDEDDVPGNRRAPLLISHTVWRTHFGSDPSVIGLPVSVGGKPFTLVGILDPSFDGLGRPVDMWMPLSAMSAVRAGGAVAWEPSPASAACCINVVGRLAKGVAKRQAIEELQLLHTRFMTATRKTPGTVELWGTAPISGGGGDRFAVISVYGAAVLLVLVLACANVGNLQLARGLARRREIATRMSIGASRARVVRQLLTEGFVLACGAGAVALGLAAILPRIVYQYFEEEVVPPYLAARLFPDGQIVLFTLAICVASCVVFALAPAIHATRATIPLGSLDRASTRPARFGLRSTLLATQIALSAVLLVGAGLVTRAIVHAMRFDPGFEVQGVSTISVTLPAGTPDKARQSLMLGVLDALARDGGEPVALAAPGPLSDAPLIMHMALPRRSDMEYDSVLLRPASSKYFEVLGIPMIAGRMFGAGIPAEAVVNEAFVRTYWRGENPIGREVRDVDRRGGVRRVFTIVGIVRDTYLTGLDKVDPVIFTPAYHGAFLTRGGPASIGRVRGAILALNPSTTVTAQPLTENLRKYLEESRMGATVAWAIGLLGLALAAVGVFGVFAYAVEERRREIGLRLALGATRAQVVRTLVSTSGRAMLLGLGAGLLLSLACGPALRSYLYGLSPLDPLAYALVLALLGTAALAATFIPARRACRLDPAVTLRED